MNPHNQSEEIVEAINELLSKYDAQLNIIPYIRPDGGIDTSVTVVEKQETDGVQGQTDSPATETKDEGRPTYAEAKQPVPTKSDNKSSDSTVPQS